MDALTIISQASPSPAGASAGTALSVGVLFTVMAACATSALLALIIARALHLHRSRPVRKSAAGRGAAPPSNQATSAALIEPKPLHPQRAA